MAGSADVRADQELNPDTGIPKPELDVTARPVDTFVRPVQASQSALGQLAGSLKEFNPALDKLQQRFQEIETQQGTAQAEEAFTKDKGDWDKAVANGDIPSFLHPYGRMAARERFGRLAGDKANGDIETDPQYILDTQNATTMQQYDTARAAARQRWEDKSFGHASHSDMLFRSNYDAMSAEHDKDARVAAVGQIEKNYVKLNGQHLQDELATHIDGLYKGGSEISSIQDQVTQMLQVSGLPEVVQRAAIGRALDALARKNMDIGIYTLADGLKVKGYDGKMYDISNDDDFIKIRSTGADEILHQKYTSERLFNAEALTRRGDAMESMTKAINQAVEANPTGHIDMQPFYSQAEAAGIPVEKVNGIFKALRGPGPKTNDFARKMLADATDPRISATDANYVTKIKLSDALSQGSIGMADFSKISAAIDKRNKKGRATGPDSLDGTYELFRGLAERVTNPAVLSTADKPFKGNIANVQIEVGAALQDAYDQWKISHPEGTSHDLNTYLKDTLGYLMEYYAPMSHGGHVEDHAAQEAYYEQEGEDHPDTRKQKPPQ